MACKLLTLSMKTTTLTRDTHGHTGIQVQCLLPRSHRQVQGTDVQTGERQGLRHAHYTLHRGAPVRGYRLPYCQQRMGVLS
jgi:hypothetical protein